MDEEPTFATGKICYIEIPATDIEQSSDFYRRAFGWKVRTRDDGSVAFDDTVGQVNGTWVTGLPPSSSPGLMIHIMVADALASVAAIRDAGGEIVEDVNDARGEVLATFRDPGGNVLGVYQQPGLAESEANG